MDISEKTRQAELFRKLAEKCGCNEDHPSISDQLVFTIVPLPMCMREKIPVFYNKYVLADCALMCTVYVFHYLYEIDPTIQWLPNLKEEKFLYKILNGMFTLYDFDILEINEIYNNRMKLVKGFPFDPISEKLELFKKEALTLIKRALFYNKYVEFNIDASPVVSDIYKSIELETQMNEFFDIEFHLINSALNYALS